MGQATDQAIQQLNYNVSQQMVPPPPAQLEDNTDAYTEQLSSEPPAQDNVGFNISGLHTQDGPSVKGYGSLSVQFNVEFEAGEINNPVSQVVDLALGQNLSETIHRLRYLALISLVFHIVVGVPYLFGDIDGDHATHLVMLISTVGAILVSIISLLVSYWPEADPNSDARNNWYTGLLIANLILLGGRRAIYWMLTLETGN